MAHLLSWDYLNAFCTCPSSALFYGWVDEDFMVHKERLSLNWVDFAPLLFALEHFMSTKTDSINHVNPSESYYYIKLLFGFFCRMLYSIKSFIFTSGTYVTKSINNPSIYNGRPQCCTVGIRLARKCLDLNWEMNYVYFSN